LALSANRNERRIEKAKPIAKWSQKGFGFSLLLQKGFGFAVRKEMIAVSTLNLCIRDNGMTNSLSSKGETNKFALFKGTVWC